MMDRNKNLKKALNGVKPKPQLKEARNIPKPDVKNIQGHDAYELSSELKLITMLNTLKLDDQFYRTNSQAVVELLNLIRDVVRKKGALFVAKCIVYSRCLGEGMRTINNVAAVLFAPYTSNKEWAKHFYSLWDKRAQKGGLIYRPDDMREILDAWRVMHEPFNYNVRGKTITNAMKKGFAKTLETLDSYQLLKYKHALRDVINVSHPNPNFSEATVKMNGLVVKTLEAIYENMDVSADTWEAAQNEAGRLVKQAVIEGKLDETEAKNVLREAKQANWAGLLKDNKLGILAALRNIRSILLTDPDNDTINQLCSLLSNPRLIREGKIMPYQIDMAHTITNAEFNSPSARKIIQALLKGYELALPNLTQLLKGNNLVIIDCSGSMNHSCTNGDLKNRKIYPVSAMYKASLIGMTIAKATNADVIQFGGRAQYHKYNPNTDVFTLAREVRANLGSTKLSTAWELALKSGRKYDRVFILSDNEVNGGDSYRSYKDYVEKLKSPYVYSIDLAAYGTTTLAGPKVRHYYGYGYAMFEDISTSEFHPEEHIEKIERIKIC